MLEQRPTCASISSLDRPSSSPSSSSRSSDSRRWVRVWLPISQPLSASWFKSPHVIATRTRSSAALPSQRIGSWVSTGTVGANTVAGQPSSSSTGGACTAADAKASSNVTATRFSVAADVAASENVTPR